MTTLADFKNHLVFDCVSKPHRVNILDQIIEDFDIGVDLKICSHCFYDSKEMPQLDNINVSHKKPRSHKKKDKKTKNKSEKKK
tara:strand:- start:126 stop:374 length:249 start_codon:yes stop_codon:yes gene_type:complete